MSIAKRLEELERRTRDLRFHPETADEARRAVLEVLPLMNAVIVAAVQVNGAAYGDEDRDGLAYALDDLRKALDDG